MGDTGPSMTTSTDFSLTPGKRVLFLTKDPEIIRRQLTGELDLRMADVDPDDLLDDINTDTMTPAWVCFRHRPEDIARDAYAGADRRRRSAWSRPTRCAMATSRSSSRAFAKGVGSSRETAVQCEKWSGIRMSVAASFAPIHGRNLINQGVMMGTYEMLARLQAGESIPLDEFVADHDPITREIIRAGGLFAFGRGLQGRVDHRADP